MKIIPDTGVFMHLPVHLVRKPFLPALFITLLALLLAAPAAAADAAAIGGTVAGEASAVAAIPSDQHEEWEIQSVRELMQQDLHEASGRPGSRQASLDVQPDAAPGVRAVLAPRLVAMYGVGRALMAEVQVGRQAFLYVRGQAYPAGHAGDKGVYQLRGMNGSCVQLERGEDRHSLCLRMLLGELQP